MKKLSLYVFLVFMFCNNSISDTVFTPQQVRTLNKEKLNELEIGMNENVVYLLTIFFAIFFVTKFYLSENNIKRSNRAILQHQKELANKFSDLPIIKSDTNDIIEHTNEVEKFLSKKPIKWLILIKDNTFDIVESINEIEEFNYLNKSL